MKERMFRFKRFEVSHSRSAMPIGVDGVLIGAWAQCEGHRILDVGTGCGVIALMMAQRYPGSDIDAIDIHKPSIEEANENFARSPWKERLHGKLMAFSAMSLNKSLYDLIVSNPPFFDSGVTEYGSPRLAARHVGTLSPFVLIEEGRGLLRENGRLAMIVPMEMSDRIEAHAGSNGYLVRRKCIVRDHDGAPFKRSMLEFEQQGHVGNDRSKETMIAEEKLTMFDDVRRPTDEYCRLCGQFYLKF